MTSELPTENLFVECALERAGDVADALISGLARVPAMSQAPSEREVVPRAPIAAIDGVRTASRTRS